MQYTPSKMLYSSALKSSPNFGKPLHNNPFRATPGGALSSLGRTGASTREYYLVVTWDLLYLVSQPIPQIGDS